MVDSCHQRLFATPSRSLLPLPPFFASPVFFGRERAISSLVLNSLAPQEGRMEIADLWQLVDQGGATAVLFLFVIYQGLQIKQRDADQKEMIKDLRALSVSYATLAEGIKNAIERLRETVDGR